MTDLRLLTWKRYLAIAVSLGAVALLLGDPIVAIAVEVIGLAAVAIGISAVRRRPAAQRRPWYWYAAGGALFLFAWPMQAAIAAQTGVDNPFPSWADVPFVAGYLCLIVGTLLFAKIRGAENDWGNILDGCIVAGGVAVVSWAFLLAPYVRDPTNTTAERVLATNYSLLSVILVASMVRLVIGPGKRSISYYFLASGMVALVVGDIASTVETTGSDADSLLNLAATVPYIFVGAAALHPSMPQITEAPGEPDPPLTSRRVILLGTALLMAPAVLLWELNQEDSVEVPVVISGTVVLSLLVLGRLTLLVRAKERTAARERVLRQVGEALVAATTHAEMRAGALEAVLKLGDSTPGVRASLATVDDAQLQVVASRGRHADRTVGCIIERYALPQSIRDGLIRRQPGVADGIAPIDLLPGFGPASPTSICVIPLVTQGVLRGALIVTTDAPLPATVAAGVESLAAEVALGLESLTLAVELQRQQSERQFRVLVEHSSDVILVIDGDGVTTFVSPASERLLGRPARSLTDQPLPLAIVHPDDRGVAAAIIERRALVAPAAGAVSPPAEPDAAEIRLQHLDGSYRWFEVRYRDLRHEPQIDGIVLTARDVTDRKGAEDRLTSSEARFRALVQSSSDAVGVVDIDGRFTYVSPAITRMLGYQPEELLGRLSGDLMAPDEVHIAFELLEQFRLERLETSAIEVQARAADGSWHTLDITLTDLRHEPAVQGVVLNCRDVTERKVLEHDLRYQALHDALTGLPNRVMFTTRITEALARPVTGLSTVAVLFIDLDDFKTVNDSLGHAAGDRLLVATAERLQRCLRPGDVAARLGGDEFGVCVETSRESAGVEEVASRLLTTLREPVNLGDREVTTAASIGIAAGTGASGIDAETLLRNADLAMYLAKERGKDRCEVFEEEMHASAFERLQLKNDLARAIERRQLRLHYQPVVSLETGRITAVEALLRWAHPERGLLGPDSFVTMAEETGLIVPVGQWALEEACQQLRAWQLELPAGAALSMSVNLSVRQLQDDGIIDAVGGALDRFGLEPSTLTLELTESMLMEDVELSQQRLAALRSIGTLLAVDDFGTGYSSLGYIQRFPVDVIKIDRSFVRDLGPHPSQRFVVQSMVELAQRLGVHIVAEGIERRDQLLALQALGCDLGQGYYFARPAPAPAMAALLAENLSGGWGDRITRP